MIFARRTVMATKGSTVIPSVRCRDAHAMISWLERVLGFARQAVYEGPGGTVEHAQMTYGLGMLMLGSVRDDAAARSWVQPDEVGGRETTGLYLVVEDCDALYAKAKAEGAEITQELMSPEYGGKSFAVRDPEGRVWGVGSYDPWAEQGVEDRV
jgi:uncharacterized glyoxalase superfamily protein PhnB